MNNICPVCKTENEPQYKFCKNCGTKLINENTQSGVNQAPPPPPAANSNPQYTYNNPNNYYQPNGYYQNNYRPVPPPPPPAPKPEPMPTVDSIDGIPMDDIKCFIGEKNTNMIGKFNKMELTGSKVSWCWPVAILGYFLGPLGAAIWFFYRKMYKIALLLVGIGLIVGMSTSLIAGDNPLEQGIINQFESGVVDFESILDSIINSTTTRGTIAAAIENIASIGTMIICGLFGCNFYKRHTVSTINAYRAKNIDERYYKMGLASIGGTSGGMIALGIAINVFATEIFAIVTRLVF